jgi:hypothetical protein
MTSITPEHRAEIVDEVLAALGLGDFDAAVERGARAFRNESANPGILAWDRKTARTVLEAALFAGNRAFGSQHTDPRYVVLKAKRGAALEEK